MSANTAFLNLYKPGGGSSGLIVPDEVVDIDRINGNMDLIDSFASSWGLASRQTRDFTGPAASLSSIVAAAGGARLNDTYKETDGSKLYWIYDGTNWINNEGGMWLIRPLQSNLVGLTVDSSGMLVPNASTKTVSVNNCFTSRFRNYKILFSYETGDNNGSWFKFRGAGVDYSAAEYRYTDMYGGAAAITTTANASAAQWGLPPVVGTLHYGELDLWQPALALPKTFIKKLGSNVSPVAEACYGNGSSTGTMGTTAFDGWTISLSNTGLNPMDVTKSWFKIYGMA